MSKSSSTLKGSSVGSSLGSTIHQGWFFQFVFNHFPQVYAFWRFARPHTIVGTSLSVLALGWIAATLTDRANVVSVLVALVACLCGNVYIVGLNQLEDIGIDRINKPHLPIASGEFSPQRGKQIVGITGVLAVLIAVSQGIWLSATIGISLVMGTAYSLPPIRLKRSPVLAALCIFMVRGVIVNLGLFLQFTQVKFPQRWQDWSTLPRAIPPVIWALTLFVIVFTFAIAIFKDIPDMEGDRQYNISTFTLRLGAQAVFNLARCILTTCYLGMAIGGLLFLPGVNTVFLLATHLLALGIFWIFSLRVDLDDRASIAQFYQFIWKLFFWEYLMFPAACWLG